MSIKLVTALNTEKSKAGACITKYTAQVIRRVGYIVTYRGQCETGGYTFTYSSK